MHSEWLLYDVVTKANSDAALALVLSSLESILEELEWVVSAQRMGHTLSRVFVFVVYMCAQVGVVLCVCVFTSLFVMSVICTRSHGLIYFASLSYY